MAIFNSYVSLPEGSSNLPNIAVLVDDDDEDEEVGLGGYATDVGSTSIWVSLKRDS
jgi:hypothetical protein